MAPKKNTQTRERRQRIIFSTKEKQLEQIEAASNKEQRTKQT